MAYTKPAVALLLAGASARVGLTLQDNWNAPFPDYTGTMIASAVPQVAGGSANTLTLTAPGSNYGCVGCIRAGNMWCSRAYLFEKTSGAYAAAVTVASNVMDPTPAFSANVQDLGQCCSLAANISIAGYSVPATSSTNMGLFNKFTCNARFSNNGGSDLANGVSGTTAGSGAPAENNSSSTQWWCSSGRNNQATYGTPANAVTIYAAGATTQTEGDPRMDIMLMNCRQRIDICGAAAVTAMTAIGAGGTTSSTQMREIVRASMTVVEKCTWVFTSDKGAPTFKATIGSTSGDPVLHSTWDLHYAEYNSGTNSQPSKGSNNMVYPNLTWSTLKARMYDTSNQKGLIEMPQAWMWVDTSATTSTAAGYMQKRWFPVQMAVNQITAQTTRNTAYTNLLSTYNGLKTTYNDVLAKNEKANKADALSKFFSPPKLEKLPLRPAPPTQPAAYGGPYQCPFPTTASSYTGVSYQSTLALVTANQFVIDGSHGGWGAFTLGMLAHSTMPVQKSFGVFGWAVDNTSASYVAEGFSFVQDWREMCTTLTTSSGSNGVCPTGVTSSTVTVTQILAVSVWSNASTAATFNTSGATGSSFKIQFNLSNWKQNSKNWGLPSQPGAATNPNTPSGAKALVAGAAAVAAIAASLY